MPRAPSIKSPGALSPVDFPASQTLLTSQAWDSVEATPGGSGGNAYVRKNSMAFYRFETEATSFSVDGVGTGSQSYMGVWVDGVYSGQCSTGTLDGVKHTAAVSGLPARMKVVEISEGTQTYIGPGDIRGMFMTAVNGARIRVISPQTVTRRLAVYADSIATTGATYGVMDAWVALTRATYPGRVSLEGWEARSFMRDDPVPAVLAQRMVDLLFDARRREIWLAIGTNDVGSYSAAAFSAAYASVLDGIRALDQRARVYCQSPLTRVSEAQPMIDYRTGIATAAASRSWCTYVHGPDILTLSDLVDGLHPSVSGHAKYAAFVKNLLVF